MQKITITFNGYDLESKDFDEIMEYLMQYGESIAIEETSEDK